MKPHLLLLLLFVPLIGLLAQTPADALLLKNYRPVSVYKIPVTIPQKACTPVIDLHSHVYASTPGQLTDWVKTMDRMGIEKTILLTGMSGFQFDSVAEVYAAFPGRFELWCGFDYTGYDKPGYGPAAVKELERCYKKGARGIGELGDKGAGELYSKPVAGYGLHIDDKRMKPLLAKCAELRMPINIHVAEPYWMYLPADSTNDGLMNAATWKVNVDEKMLDHAELIQSLENAVRDNPATLFIACHFANCEYDLSIPARLLDTYPNLYLDIAARYAETATIPRYMATFYSRYQDRLLYGTDMGMDESMYRTTFRILETLDEHFYEINQFGYHWALSGFGLPVDVLKKIYKSNALKISDYQHGK